MALEKACFGAGCFWGVEKWYKKQFPNLKNIAVGYMGGSKHSPTYEQVCTGTTGHAEVLYFEFDPRTTKYEDLVTFFFRVHDPTTLNRQQGDVGTQYRSAIFFYTPEQEKIAHQVKTRVQEEKRFGTKPIVTEITPAGEFCKGEPNHQQYLDRNPNGYCTHRMYW